MKAITTHGDFASAVEWATTGPMAPVAIVRATDGRYVVVTGHSESPGTLGDLLKSLRADACHGAGDDPDDLLVRATEAA